ncbi:MAG: hypothetical protein AAGA56_07525 [Myxococcota bacterium]
MIGWDLVGGLPGGTPRELYLSLGPFLPDTNPALGRIAPGAAVRVATSLSFDSVPPGYVCFLNHVEAAVETR